MMNIFTPRQIKNKIELAFDWWVCTVLWQRNCSSSML